MINIVKKCLKWRQAKCIGTLQRKGIRKNEKKKTKHIRKLQELIKFWKRSWISRRIINSNLISRGFRKPFPTTYWLLSLALWDWMEDQWPKWNNVIQQSVESPVLHGRWWFYCYWWLSPVNEMDLVLKWISLSSPKRHTSWILDAGLHYTY